MTENDARPTPSPSDAATQIPLSPPPAVGESTPRRPAPLRRRPTLRGEAPTESMPMLGSLRGSPYRDPRVTRAVAEEHAVTEVIDLCLRIAEVMLRSGAAAPTVEAAVNAIALTGGIQHLDVDLTMQSLHIQARTPSGSNVTRLRVVHGPQMDFARLAAVHSLVDDIVSGEVEIDQARARVREIRRAPRTWARWMVVLGEGMLAAGVAMALGAGALGVLVALLTAVVVERTLRLVSRFYLPDFYTGAIGGAVATFVAFGAYLVGRVEWMPMSPSDFAFVVAGGIVALLPARSIKLAMDDIIGGYSVTGTARLVAVLMHSFGLIVGVAGGLGISMQLMRALGVVLEPPQVDQLAWASANPPTVVLGSAVLGLGGAVTLHCSRQMLLPATVLTVLTVVVAAAMTQSGVGRITATGLAAVVMGFAARVLALRADWPPITLSLPASFGLMPGLSIFVGLYHLTVPDGSAYQASSGSGWESVMTALGVLMALATGTTLGELIAAPLDSPVNRRRRMLVGRQGHTNHAAEDPTPDM